MASMSGGGQPAPSAVTPIQFTVPEGWQQKPPGGMRVASFLVERDGRRADVSIIPLSGASGGELANANRWRNQVGLEPVDEAKLASEAAKVTVGDHPAPLYDLSGTDPQTKQPTRIIGSMLPMGPSTWYFKMTGDDALVTEEKSKFEAFLKSIRFEAPHGAAAPADPHQGMSVKSAAAVMDSGVTAADKPKWSVPEGWTEKAPSSMRIATFEVTGDKGAKADVSVSRLAANGGGNLLNVNRWRAQVGLPPVDDAGLTKLLEDHEGGSGKFLVTDMAGQSVESGQASRILVAIVPRSGTTWYYKMFGDDQLVAQHKTAFLKFVESARYPNAS